MWVDGHLRATTLVCGGHRRACGSQFSLPTMWVLDVLLWPSVPPSSLLSNEDSGDSGTHLTASWELRVGSEGQTWHLALTLAALSTVSLSPR